MQNRHERRRRVTNDDSPQGVSANHRKRSSKSRNAAAARREQAVRITDLMPLRYHTIMLLALLGVLLVGGLEFLHTRLASLRGMLPEADLSLINLGSPRSIGVCFAATLTMMAGLTSLVIYSLRRHRVDDYYGRYRLWLWSGMVWLLVAFHELTGIFGVVEALVVRYTRGFKLPGPNVWIIASSAVAGLFTLWLLIEIRRTRAATGILLSAVALVVMSVGLEAGWLVASEGTARVMLIAGGQMLGNLFALLALGLHARHVIRETYGIGRKKKGKLAADKSQDESQGGASASGTAATRSPGSANSASQGGAGASGAAGQGMSVSEYDDEDDDGDENRHLSRAERKRLRREKKIEQRRAA